jgi:hypothetical protein
MDSTLYFLAALAPLFILFELAQIIVLERYIGLRTLKAEIDPRTLPFPKWLAIAWIIFTKIYLLWTIALIFESSLILPASVILITSFVGLISRRSAGLQWALVILTFETAIRIGMLILVTRFWLSGQAIL